MDSEKLHAPNGEPDERNTVESGGVNFDNQTAAIAAQTHDAAATARSSEAASEEHVASITKKIEQIPTHPLLQELTKNIPTQLLDKALDVRTIEKTLKELDADPETATLFTELVLSDNREALRAKSEAQLEKLRKIFNGDTPFYNLPEKLRKKKKIDSFKKVIASMKPTRADKRVVDTFISPRNSGNVASYGPQDVVIQADKFVYASLSGIRHFMTRGDANIAQIDESECADRAHIVMQDFANIVARSSDKPIKKYLDNMFDYKNGKEILAYYLAIIFDSPEEALRFLEQNNHPAEAQRWDVGLAHYTPPFNPETPTQKPDPNWLQNIISQMKHIEASLGIEPPLSLEVKILDHANVTP